MSMTFISPIKSVLRRILKPPPQYSGAHSKNWWMTRDNAEKSSANAYWDGRDAAARRLMAQIVGSLDGNSLLEIGCHAGPVLWAVSQGRNFSRLAGTELSPTILEFARETLPKSLGRDVELVQASADNLPFTDKSFDIIVTNLVLSCIGPDDIGPSLSEILRVGRRYLVFGEPQGASIQRDREDRYYETTYWIRNYARMLEGKARLLQRHEVRKDIRIGHLDEIAVFEIE